MVVAEAATGFMMNVTATERAIIDPVLRERFAASERERERNRCLTDEEVDALASPRIPDTPERLRDLLEWGRRAGIAALRRYRKDGDQQENPFLELPGMPMHRGWEQGYRQQQ